MILMAAMLLAQIDFTLPEGEQTMPALAEADPVRIVAALSRYCGDTGSRDDVLDAATISRELEPLPAKAARALHPLGKPPDWQAWRARDGGFIVELVSQGPNAGAPTLDDLMLSQMRAWLGDPDSVDDSVTCTVYFGEIDAEFLFELTPTARVDGDRMGPPSATKPPGQRGGTRAYQRWNNLHKDKRLDNDWVNVNITVAPDVNAVAAGKIEVRSRRVWGDDE